MKTLHSIGIGGIVLLAAVFQACGGDSNPGPSDDDSIEVPEGGAPGTGGGSTTGGSGPGTGGDGGAGTGGTFEPPPDRPDCSEEPDGTQPDGEIEGTDCWDVSACNGTEEIQFLEQCSGTCFAPFDNEDRIEGFTGTLPPLP